jgi:predicted Kef-type K+ transport protein
MIFFVVGILFIMLGFAAIVAIILFSYGLVHGLAISELWGMFFTGVIFGGFLCFLRSDYDITELISNIGVLLIFFGLWAGINLFLETLNIISIVSAANASIGLMFIFFTTIGIFIVKIFND